MPPIKERFTVVKTARAASLSGLKTRSFPAYRTIFMSAKPKAANDAISSVPTFNPFSAEFRENPYPIYHHLRQLEPVHKTRDFFGAWLLTRYADVKQVLNDPRAVVDDLPDRLEYKSSYLQGQTFDRLVQTIRPWLFFNNPPNHSRLRSVVSKAFSAGELEQLRPKLQSLVGELLNAVRAKGEMDIIADLAAPLPVLTISELLGIPVSDRPQLIQWSQALFRVFDQPMSLQGYAQMEQVAVEFRTYFENFLVERENFPQDDLISWLILARDKENTVNREELLGLCAMLFSVGQETTENAIGNSVLALLNHPEQRSLLQQQPELIARAFEELLRYDSPVQILARIARADIEIDGQTIRNGDRIYLALGATNRDPERFPEPDRLDITRPDVQNLPFGAGIHFCLGAYLARLQGQIAINTLLRSFPDLQRTNEPLRWRKSVVLRGVEALPVVFKPS